MFRWQLPEINFGERINTANIVAMNLDETANQRTFADGSKRAVVVLASVAVGRRYYLPG